MIGAIRFMTETVGLPLDEALRMASLYPAQFLGIDRTHGRIAPGIARRFRASGRGSCVAGVYHRRRAPDLSNRSL